MSDLIKSSIQFLEESTGQIDEISKKTLGSYVNKAISDIDHNSNIAGAASAKSSLTARDGDDKTSNLYANIAHNKRSKSLSRAAGVSKAIKRLTKEDLQDLVNNIDQLDEEQKYALVQAILASSEE